ncbi:serine/threonine-protein kinase [Spirillospora sp. NBC_00431]
MGRVFLGRGPSGDLVAVKVVHARFAHRPDHRERFAREIAAVRSVDSAYVAPVVDHDVEATEPWLATAYLPGLNLQQAVKLHGPLPGPSVRALAAALAVALKAVHRAGVQHRDLKPSNLVLTPDGPRIVDFGIARPHRADTITIPGALLGTPGYLPPERIRDRDSGRPGDIFAFGALLVYAATGESPFGDGSAQALLYRTQFEEPRLDGLRSALDGDPEFVEIIATCLARDPARRPTAAELAGRIAGEPEKIAGEPEITGAPRPSGEVAPGLTHSDDAGPGGRGWPIDPQGRRAVLALGLAAGLALSLASSARDRPRTRSPAGADGRSPLWTHRSPDDEGEYWFLRPTVAGNVVYLSSTRGLQALDCARGDLLWTFNRGSPVHSGVAVLGPDVFHDAGTVVFSDGRLHAVDVVDGSPATDWDESGISVTGVPAVIGKRFYLCYSFGRLTAFDGVTGHPRWSLELTRGGPDAALGSRAEPDLDTVAAGDRVYAAVDGLIAVDIASREVRWRFDDADRAPVIRRGRIYSAGGHHVYALDEATGAVRWSRDIGGRAGCGVTVAAGLVFAGDAAGRLHALDAATGRPRWRFDTDGPLRAAPSVAAGTVYAAADQDRLYAIGAVDGRPRWSHPLGRQTKVQTQLWRGSVLACVDLTRLCAFPL